MNTLRTGLLLAAMTGLFLAVGALIGGSQGVLIAFGIALAMNAFAYWNSDKVLLRMYGARQVDAASAPELFRMIERLAQNAAIPMPKVYIMENPQPNAFATGRDPQHAAVAFTTGIIEQLSSEELAGVAAHELAHIKHRDTLTMTITAVIAGAISMLANMAFFMGGDRRNQPGGMVVMLLVTLLAPIAAMLVQAAISRSREFEADRAGAEISGRPMWLASALGQIERSVRGGTPNPEADANPATAHLFIINPLHGGHSGFNMAGLFSTHPSTEERIARLTAMAGPEAVVARRGPWG